MSQPVDDNNASSAPPPETAEAMAVPAPGLVQVTATAASSISLQWLYANGAGERTGTEVSWGLDYDNPLDTVDLPIRTSRYVIQGLMPQTKYYISLRGMNSEGYSYPSPITAITQPATALPARPSDLTASATKDAVDLTWRGPVDAAGYRISYGLGPNAPVIETITTTAQAFTVTGLTSNTLYYFDVQAFNNQGESLPMRTTATTLQVPNSPANLTAVPAITAMELEWPGSQGAIEYYIRYGVEPNGTVRTETTRTQHFSLTGLSRNTLYFIEVSARGAHGESLPTRITQRTLEGPAIPGRPMIGFVQVAFDTVRITCGAPQYPNYEIAYGIDDADREVIGTATTPDLSCLIRHLAFGTRYFFEVRAVNESGPSEPAMTFATTGPDETQPRNLRVPSRTFSGARLTWERPLDTSYFRDYEITCPGRPVVHTAALEYIATGLTPGDEYVFKVQPRRLESARPARYESVQVPSFYTSTCSPGNLRGYRTTSTSAILTWDEPYSTCLLCPDALGYEVSGGGIATINVTQPPCVINGLRADVEYSLEVYAKAGGNIRSLPSPVFLGLSPGKPGTLQASDITGLSVLLRWTAPDASIEVFDYLIYCNGTFLTCVSGLEHQVTNLSELTSYTFGVKAREISGNLSDPSNCTFKTLEIT